MTRPILFLAGVLGIEPRLEVLETPVIPFHHTPKGQGRLIKAGHNKPAPCRVNKLFAFGENQVSAGNWAETLNFKLFGHVYLVALGLKAEWSFF